MRPGSSPFDAVSFVFYVVFFVLFVLSAWFCGFRVLSSGLFANCCTPLLYFSAFLNDSYYSQKKRKEKKRKSITCQSIELLVQDTGLRNPICIIWLLPLVYFSNKTES